MNNDLISRSELKKTLCEDYEAREHYIGQMMLKAIDNAPAVQAYPIEQVLELVKLNQQFAQEIEHLKRPQGEWQYTTHYARRYRICPFCKSEKEDDRSGGWFYCWHCGADMRGGIDNAPAVAINKDFYKIDKSNPINRSDLFQ